MDVLWSDVSEHQVPVDDSYPFEALAIRSNDGTYKDKDFPTNYAWATTALDSGRLCALIIYMVYRPNWQQTLDATKAIVGTPHPQTAFMIDVESWDGQITGDNSDGINRLYWGLADWLGDPARVIGYGNTGDLNTLWPTKPDGLRLIVAGYGTNPNYPGKLGHQFTDGQVGGPLLVPPFGAADVNSADGYDLSSFCAALGLGDTVTAGDIWNYVLPDPYVDPNGTAATPKTAADLLGWAATHAAYAKEQATAAKEQTTAALAEVALLKTAIAALSAVVSADPEITPEEFKAILDAELGKLVTVQVSVTEPHPAVKP